MALLGDWLNRDLNEYLVWRPYVEGPEDGLLILAETGEDALLLWEQAQSLDCDDDDYDGLICRILFRRRVRRRVPPVILSARGELCLRQSNAPSDWAGKGPGIVGSR